MATDIRGLLADPEFQALPPADKLRVFEAAEAPTDPKVLAEIRPVVQSFLQGLNSREPQIQTEEVKLPQPPVMIDTRRSMPAASFEPPKPKVSQRGMLRKGLDIADDFMKMGSQATWNVAEGLAGTAQAGGEYLERTAKEQDKPGYVGGAIKSIGTELADMATKAQQGAQADNPKLKQNFVQDPSLLVDPEWIIPQAGSAVGSMLPFLVLGMGAGAAVDKVVAATTVKAALRPLVTAGAQTGASTAMETLVDAGSNYREAIDKGMDKKRAQSVYIETALREVGPTALFNLAGMWNPLLKGKTKQIAASLFGEGSQEVAQGAAQRTALNAYLPADQQQDVTGPMPMEFLLGAMGGAIGEAMIPGTGPGKAQGPALPTAPLLTPLDLLVPEAGGKPEVNRPDLAPTIEEPPTAPLYDAAVTGTGKIKLGVDLPNLGAVLGSSLYSGDPAQVITKELLQNSFDAIRGSAAGEVSVTFDTTRDEETISISDNGIGMTKQQLQTVFLDLGASGKRDLSDASGGFGLAKAAPLLIGKSIKVVSVAQEENGRFEHTFESTPDQLMGEGVEMHSRPVPLDTPTGTTIISTLKEDSGTYSARTFLANLRAFSPGLPGKIIAGRADYTENVIPITDLPEEASYAPTKLTSLNLPGSDIGVYTFPEVPRQNRGSFELRVANNGIYQFGETIYVKPVSIPKNILVDLHSTVKEGHPDYPFTANREALRGDLKKAISAKIQELIVNPAAEAATAEMIQAYKTMPVISFGPGEQYPVYDVGGRLSPEELLQFISSPRTRILTKAIADITKKMAKIATGLGSEIGTKAVRFGVVFSDEIHGVHIPNPENPSEVTILINPFSGTWTTDPDRLASRVHQTIKHELVHDAVSGHVEDFTSMENSLDEMLGAKEQVENLLRLRRIYGADKGDTLHSELAEALRVYKESRRREASTLDIFGGQGSSFSRQPSANGAEQGAGIVSTGGAEVVPVDPAGQGRAIAGTERTGGDVVAEDLGELGVTSPESADAVTKFLQIGAANEPELPPPPTEPDPESLAVMAQADELLKALGINEHPPKVPKPVFDRQTLPEFKANQVKWNWLYKNFATLIQIAQANPAIVPLQAYVEDMRAWWKNQLELMIPGDKVAKAWWKLGKQQGSAVSEFLLDATTKSWRLRRKLKPMELVKLAQKAGVKKDGFQLAQAVFDSLDETRNKLKEVLVEVAEKRLGGTDALEPMLDKIEEQFGILENRHYFPLKRFGEHIIKVIANDTVYYGGKKYPKNAIIASEHFETKWERDHRMEELEAEFSGPAYEVQPDTLLKESYSFVGFPPALLDAFRDRLKLDDDQFTELQRFIVDLAPSMSFVKSLKKRRGIQGFSHDGIMAYTSYMMQAAKNIARTRYRDQMQQHITDINQVRGTGKAKLTEIRNSMVQHYDDVMQPKNDFVALNAWLFNFYFVLVPQQILANFTQVVWSAMPRVIAELPGNPFTKDVRGAKMLAQATDDTFDIYARGGKHLTETEQQWIKWGTEDGTVIESYPAEIAGFAHGSPLQRMLPTSITGLAGPLRSMDRGIRTFTEKGIAPWKLSEQVMRHAVLLMGARVGAMKGMDAEASYRFGRNLVNNTMYEYAPWNRGKAFRRFRAPLMFKLMLEHILHNLLTWQPGTGRTLLAMLALAGLRGLPGFQDIEAVINAVGTRVGLGDRPYFDLEQRAREALQGTIFNPHLLFNGLSSDVLNPFRLSAQLDHVLPMLDISAKMQFGRVVPGLGALTDVVKGIPTTAEKTLFDAGKELLGAGGGYGYNVARAMIDDSPKGHMFRRFILPAFVKNMAEGLDMLVSGQSKTVKGDPIANYDPGSSPADLGEIVAKFFGIAESGKTTREQAKTWAMIQTIQFYQARKAALMRDWDFNRQRVEDREASADIMKAISKYNGEISRHPELAGFGITSKDLNEYAKRNARRDYLIENDLPRSRREAPLGEVFQKLYPPARPTK